jgi:hypothetical protein
MKESDRQNEQLELQKEESDRQKKSINYYRRESDRQEEQSDRRNKKLEFL